MNTLSSNLFSEIKTFNILIDVNNINRTRTESNLSGALAIKIPDFRILTPNELMDTNIIFEYTWKVDFKKSYELVIFKYDALYDDYIIETYYIIGYYVYDGYIYLLHVVDHFTNYDFLIKNLNVTYITNNATPTKREYHDKYDPNTFYGVDTPTIGHNAVHKKQHKYENDLGVDTNIRTIYGDEEAETRKRYITYTYNDLLRKLRLFNVNELCLK